MKKIIAMLLILLTVMCLLSGCSKTNKDTAAQDSAGEAQDLINAAANVVPDMVTPPPTGYQTPQDARVRTLDEEGLPGADIVAVTAGSFSWDCKNEEGDVLVVKTPEVKPEELYAADVFNLFGAQFWTDKTGQYAIAFDYEKPSQISVSRFSLEKVQKAAESGEELEDKDEKSVKTKFDEEEHFCTLELEPGFVYKVTAVFPGAYGGEYPGEVTYFFVVYPNS